MKHEHWELVIDGKLANRFKDWEIDAEMRAANLSYAAPLLTVELYEVLDLGAKLVSTWRKGKKVKA